MPVQKFLQISPNPLICIGQMYIDFKVVRCCKCDFHYIKCSHIHCFHYIHRMGIVPVSGQLLRLEIPVADG